MSTLFISAAGALNQNEINRHQDQNTLLVDAHVSTAHSVMLSALNSELEKSSIQSSRKKQHVIVVGAGISGLRAGSVLQRHGVAVTVLEGRADRIGGRICTSRKFGKAARDIGKYT
jgi:polyamine oxidase